MSCGLRDGVGVVVSGPPFGSEGESVPTLFTGLYGCSYHPESLPVYPSTL